MNRDAVLRIARLLRTPGAACTTWFDFLCATQLIAVPHRWECSFIGSRTTYTSGRVTST